ncbi:YncE family protein [Salinibacillus xinjiangensis]|uniref:Uncharacterized protein n=1 Tax=Salinibacillus xinjiangensis TaxID=1229268 RepID=A0A6G1X9I1_9BACI|nr:hypothetical protein [Salinibacillus xinjiangensis]MRG87602.1 hypothetical protein [Salinibacillus xinjiangensis]
MRKSFIIFIISTLLISIVITESLINKAYASDDSVISLESDNLVDWILDKENNTIYAITTNGNLHYISLDSFQIINTFPIGKNPVDLDRQDDQLYISLPDFSAIKVFDLVSQKVVKDIQTSYNPYRIAVSHDQIFYVDDQSETLYDYSLATASEVEVTVQGENYSSFYKPVIHLEDETDTLYIAETNLSGTEIEAISTIDYAVKSQSTFDEGYGFPYPERHLLLDGQEVYFAGHKINQTNLEEIYGVYTENYSPNSNNITAADVLAVDENYVYSTKSIFDRETYRKVGSFQSEVSHILTNGQERYIYNADDHTITIHNDTFSAPSVESEVLNNKLLLDQQVDDWVMDETNNRIYAISESSNELIYIDTNTMKVVARQFIGSIPTDIEYLDGKLYIALFGGTKVAVTEPIPNVPVTYITTKQNPFEIETDGTNLYYTKEDQWVEIYHIDLSTNTEKIIEPTNTNVYNYYEANIELDSQNNQLYIAESGLSGSSLYVMNVVNGSHVMATDYNDGYGFPYPGRQMLLDDQYVYYAGFRLQKSDITVEQGSYFNKGEDLVSLQGDYVFSSHKIYHKDTLLPVYTFPQDIRINLANTNSKGEIFLSVPGKNAIYKFNSLEELQQRIVKNPRNSFNPNGKFQLNWDMVTGDGYNIYAKKTDAETMNLLNTSPLMEQQYTVTDSQLKNWYGNTVQFGVRSVFGESESTDMKTIEYTFDIPVPSNLQSKFEEVPVELKEQYGETFFTVTWDPVNLIDGYNFYYYTDDSTVKTKVDNISADDQEVSFPSSFTESWEGKTVYFQVASVVNGKESNLSEAHSYTFGKNSDDSTPEEQQDKEEENGDNEQPSSEPTTDNNTDNEELHTDEEPRGKTEQPENGSDKDSSNVDSEEEQSDESEENHTTKEESTTSEQNSQNDGNKVYVHHTKEGNTVVVSEEQFNQLENNSEVGIDLTDSEDPTSEVLFTTHQITVLKRTNSSISIEKDTTSVYLPSSIFDDNAQETRITLKKEDAVTGAISDVYDFTITQGKDILSQFSEPVLLSFKVDKSKVDNPDNVKVYYYNEEEQSWELIGGVYKDGVVTAETNHFSKYAVFEKEQTASADEQAQKNVEEKGTEKMESEDHSEKADSSTSTFIWIIVGVLAVIGLIVIYIRKRR